VAPFSAKLPDKYAHEHRSVETVGLGSPMFT
jgi:hypothetical protein